MDDYEDYSSGHQRSEVPTEKNLVRIHRFVVCGEAFVSRFVQKDLDVLRYLLHLLKNAGVFVAGASCSTVRIVFSLRIVFSG